MSASIVRRPTLLADGRELIYFDDADTTLGSKRAVDSRILDARPATATMRLDVLTGEWVSIAAARQNRAFLPSVENDPLAPQSATNPSEIPSLYDVAVFENRSPSFGPLHVDPNAPLGLDDLGELGIGRTRTSVGRCEVVCFSPEHEGALGNMSTSRVRTVIEAWADRTAALSAMPGIQQVFPFENRGQEIGVTLNHPHGQIYAYPYVTPRTSKALQSAAKLPNMFEQILEFEKGSERVVLAGEYWTAFVPFAARWPLEVHMMPNRHIADLAETTDAERDELAVLYPRLLRAFDALYDTPTPYIAAWHQAPVNVGRDVIRLNLQLTSPRRAADKLKFLAGSESAMGAFIGDIVPEAQAEFIRGGIARA
ncbi:MAG: galactose-1-phosphate uridylyltransferase [Microbacteriaceae bacterium]